MDEGLEVIKTLHRSGLIADLRRSFATTNCIENKNLQIEKHPRKLKCRKTSPRICQRKACELVAVKLRIRKVNNCTRLHEMCKKITNNLQIVKMEAT